MDFFTPENILDLEKCWWVFLGVAAAMLVLVFMQHVAYFVKIKEHKQWLLQFADAMIGVDKQVAARVSKLDKKIDNTVELLGEVSKSLVSLNEKLDNLKDEC